MNTTYRKETISVFSCDFLNSLAMSTTDKVTHLRINRNNRNNKVCIWLVHIFLWSNESPCMVSRTRRCCRLAKCMLRSIRIFLSPPKIHCNLLDQMCTAICDTQVITLMRNTILMRKTNKWILLCAWFDCEFVHFWMMWICRKNISKYSFLLPAPGSDGKNIWRFHKDFLAIPIHYRIKQC